MNNKINRKKMILLSLVAALLPHVLQAMEADEQQCLNAANSLRLVDAVEDNNLQEVKRLLAVPGIDANAASPSGHTTLMWAAHRGHREVVKTLIAGGANVNAVDEFGNTTLMWAAHRGHREVVKALIASGADVKAINRGGNSAKDYAVNNRYQAIVGVLNAAGANAAQLISFLSIPCQRSVPLSSEGINPRDVFPSWFVDSEGEELQSNEAGQSEPF